jgi:hypothetical protein
MSAVWCILPWRLSSSFSTHGIVLLFRAQIFPAVLLRSVASSNFLSTSWLISTGSLLPPQLWSNHIQRVLPPICRCCVKLPKCLLRNSTHGTVNSSMLVGQTPKSTLWTISCLLAGLYGLMLSGSTLTSCLIHSQGLGVLLPIYQAHPTRSNTVP